MSEPVFFDGDFREVSAVGPRLKTFPFEGDTESFYFEQDFWQLIDTYERLPLDSPDTEIPHAYLVEESAVRKIGGGVGEFTRTYSTIPVSRIERETYAHTVPGITPDEFLVVQGVASYANGVVTTANPHGFVAGDLVVITYTVQPTGSQLFFYRAVERIVRSATTYTVTVDPILDTSGTISWQLIYRRNLGRKPFTQQVLSYLHYDYFLPGVSTGITSVSDIPILNPTPIVNQLGDRVDSYSSYTTPTVQAYRLAVLAANQIVVEASALKRWKGNIYERVTRYAVII